MLCVQHVTYVCGRKYKQEKKVVGRVQRAEIQRGRTCTWTEALLIPPLPPSYLRGCKLITTQYLLQVTNIVFPSTGVACFVAVDLFVCWLLNVPGTG